MKKQTKTIITRKVVEEKLRTDNTASIKHIAVYTSALALALGIVSAIFLSLLPSGYLWLDILLWVFFIGIVGAPIWVASATLMKALTERKHLKNGDVEIVVLPLLYETEETRYTRRTREEYLQHKFHFEGFDACLASPEQSKAFARGDEFYIVYYKGTKKIQLRYPLAFYEYQEEEK